jgi:peptide/nickel transport system substrate-binding protein
MKTYKLLSILVLLSMILAACGTPTAVVTVPTQPPAPTNTSVAPVAPTATQAAAQPPSQATATQAAVAAATVTSAPAQAAGPYDNYLFATLDEYKTFSGKTIDKFAESPSLTAQVTAGKLPPLEQRLPKDVAVIKTREGSVAKFGGEMHVLGYMDGTNLYTTFTEDMTQGLSAYDVNNIRHPNIAKSWELSADMKTLTVNLRQGMKWSDGVDFNADDFVFWYEDILQNKDLNPDINPGFMPGGQLMGLKKIDDYTLEYTFAAPYPRAVENIVGRIIYPIYSPAHFFKQYLPKYNPDANALAESEGATTWQQAVQAHSSYASDTKAPRLNPWILSEISSSSALWVRNPYYWRVDMDGNQLPYIDSLLVTIVESFENTVTIKVMTGEDQYEITGLSISDYPVLKQNEAQGDYKVYLYPDTTTSTAMGFALNYTVQDPELNKIFNDLRFRQALSLAINRDDISQTIFFDKTVPFTSPASPAWTGYEAWMGTYYAEYDVNKANALLDDMGLKWDSAHQYRLRSDGKPLEILGEHTLDYLGYADTLLQMVAKYWADIGVKFTPKFEPFDVLNARYVANEQEIGIWNSDGGSEETARIYYPIRLEPPWHWMFGADCCAMSSYPWRQWLDTNGAQGIEPPAEIKQLYKDVQDWLDTPTGTPEYTALIKKIITTNVINLYYFGTVSAPPRVFAISNKIGNMPQDDGTVGTSGTHPYMPETAFFR